MNQLQKKSIPADIFNILDIAVQSYAATHGLVCLSHGANDLKLRFPLDEDVSWQSLS